MGDILDGALLRDALLAWGGGDITPRASRLAHEADNEDAGQQTPRPVPGLAHPQGHLRALSMTTLMSHGFDDSDGLAVDDDIDADSVLDASTTSLDEQIHHAQQPRHSPPPTLTPAAAAAAEKELPPLPPDRPLPSPPPEIMSCSLARLPSSESSNPSEVPELMPDQEDFLGTAASPSASGPATPSVATDLFRPLAQLTEPDLELRPFSKMATAEPDLHDQVRSLSIESAQSDAANSDGLGIIREEGDDAAADSASLLSPTEVSFGNSTGEGKQGFLSVGNRRHSRSISSSGSASVSSGEHRSIYSSGARRSISLFSSHARNGRRGHEEEFLVKRSLTPARLSTPPQGLGDPEEELVTPGAISPTSPVFHGIRAAPSAPLSFFRRMPWLSDAQSKKPEPVFGVDLKDSIRVAPMKIRISHKGRSTSYRTFPLSVHKCCEFIRRKAGGEADIFSSPGNAFNVSSLKSIFSQAPTFGEQFDFEASDYTVYDAARLILVYLEELPKPLISPSVVKSWILLARQEGAIEPPCPRVETGLDFWTEALNRLPTANRNLAKHLLTLFAELLLGATTASSPGGAAAGGISEADARQLASAVSRALFHQDADGERPVGKNRDAKRKPVRRDVQPTLALAFLIKKRGEYAVALNEASGRGSSKRDSKLFLPSTREIMEWKGGQ